MNGSKYLSLSEHTLAWFRKQIEDEVMELRASFQREAVWSDRQKSYLIDTILRGLPVPEMYIQEKVSDDGMENFVVVDGQQRLRACMDFVGDKLVLVGEEVGPLAGKKFSDLSPDQRHQVFQYKFVVRKLPELDEKTLRDIFRRINKNTVTLNAQELRHATYLGKFIRTAERIAVHTSWARLSVFSANDIRRMRNVEFVAEVLLARIAGDQNKKVNLEKAFQAYENTIPGGDTIENEIAGVLTWIEAHFKDFNQFRWRKKSDFYTLLCVMSAAGYGNRIKPPYLSDPDTVIERLKSFSHKVDTALKGADNSPSDAYAYAMAVDRAASDLGNRRRRREIVEKLLLSAAE